MLKGYEISSLYREHPRYPFESRHLEMRLGLSGRAALDVIAERERQKAVEGYTEAHDDDHVDESLAQAAACYAMPDGSGFIHSFWPSRWQPCRWKPNDRRKNLVRAGALVLAEIERLDRARVDHRSTPLPRAKGPRAES